MSPEVTIPKKTVSLASGQFMAAARELREWIPVANVLPPDHVEVLVTDGHFIFLGFVGFDRRWHYSPRCPAPDGHVSHWQPKPLLPDGRVEQ